MLGAILEFFGQILFDIFFDAICAWTGEIILFVFTLAHHQPDFNNPSGWSSWLGLAFWIAIAAGVVFVLIQLGIIKF